jgi:trigger factor
VQTTLEDAEKHTVRMTVEVTPDEFAKDLDRAYRKVAGQVRIPGVRKGRAPRQVIDAMVGHEVVLEEFVHDTVPEYYAKAVNEHELVPISEPEIDVGDVSEAEPLRFTVTVEVRPRVELEPSDYEGLRVEVPSIEPTEAEVDEYVDRLRERFAELETVGRVARTGDYVLADVRGHVHDQEIPEATQIGYLAEVGDAKLLPELNAELDGARSGDILKFNATMPEGSGDHAGQEIAFQVLVKEVKAKKLPEADDGFATTASEFDTMEELRADIRTRIREVKETESETTTRDRALAALVANVQVDIPERMVDEETEHHVRTMARRAERLGVSLEQLMEAQGIDELRLRSDARAHAVREISADLALEAVARNEGIEATPEEIDSAVKELAAVAEQDPKALRRSLDRSGRIIAVAGDIIRRKALDMVVERAELVPADAAKDPTDAPMDVASDLPEDQPGETDHD